MTEQVTPIKVSAFAKAALQFQVFLLRRGWMGKMGEAVMVITTTGRKSGQPFSTPIGFVRDGDAYVALSNGGDRPRSNWYLNLRANPQAVLELKDRRVPVRVEFLDAPEQRTRVIELFRQQRAELFDRFFGVAVDAPWAELEKAFASRLFVRFTPDE